jgi:hydrogenase maturation factor
MKLKITAVRDQGNIEKERVVLRVENNCDIGEYILLQTGFVDGSVNTRIYATFWFPDKAVKVGDFVVVYTKKGKDSERPFKDGTSYFFYMGLTEAIWKRDGRSAVLMNAPSWQSFQVAEDL